MKEYIIFYFVSLIMSQINNTVGLHLIGTIQGKSFYAERAQMVRNWSLSKQHCQRAGMHLATITSPNQLRMLLKDYKKGSFGGFHWIGGRDAQRPSQFVWDYNNGTLENSVFDSFVPFEYRTCVAVHIISLDRAHFYSLPCENSLYLICEQIHGRY